MTEDKSFDSDYELIEKVNLKPVYLNIEELKQTFQQMIGEIKTENAKQNSVIKEIIEQKDEKIISLVKQQGPTDEKIDDLTLEMEQANNFNYLCFVHVANKWKEFDVKFSYCCENKCINTENPIGKCIEGNGFANIINDEEIEYIEWFKKKGCFGGYNHPSYIIAENSFNKPKEDFKNYSLFYFEIKTKTDEEDKNRHMGIGLRNSKDNYVRLLVGATYAKIFHYRGDGIKIENLVVNNNDVYGCGLVYPPTNMSKKFPYIFFTKNGEQIGKAIFLNDSFGDCKPYIGINCCSVETNFGKDLKAKPFIYDLTKHKNTHYADFEKDLNELFEMFPLIGKEAIKQIMLPNGGIKENVLKKLNEIFPKED
uniref:SPRY domain-containing protein n=1 Tax=Meloidogyne hapla TaxID=6305 RepID=A0A1I8BG73_MELHA